MPVDTLSLRARVAALIPAVIGCLATVGLGSVCEAAIRVPSDQPTIQAGLDAATPGDTVLVASGVYTGIGNRNLDFGGKNLRLVSAAGAAVTILDGEMVDARAIHFRRGESFGTLVEGFTFRNFRPLLATGTPDGGGILIEPGCHPLVQYCTFTGNVTAGGSVQHCLFTGNGSGGGTTAGHGGGVFMQGATFFGCTIRENWASDFEGMEGAGGGVAIPGGNLTQCTIIGNRAAIGGGVFSHCPFVSLYLTNCTIAGNFARVSGGGIATTCDDVADLVMDRCLVWGNGACGVPDMLLDGADMTALILCSLVDPASVGGAGTPDYNATCVFTDPHFCDPEECAGLPPFSDGYGLAADSPARPGNNVCGQLIGASSATCALAGVGGSAGPAGIGTPALDRPVPNPAAARVTFGISSGIQVGSRVEIQVFDVAGRFVRTLFDASGGAGLVGGSLTWDLRDQAGALVPKGVYFVHLRSDNRHESRPVVVAH